MMRSSGYTLENYRQLIACFQSAGYAFGEYDGDLSIGRIVLLRHDIDYTLSYAVEFARINAEMGVAGTFFLPLRSRLYNLFDYDVQQALKEITDWGQHFGFHAVVDAEFDSIESLREFVAEDFALFSRCVPKTSPVFAWHNPGVLSSRGFNFIHADFPGLINVYGEFGPEPIPYFADSNMRHTFEELCALADQGHRVLQLAIAPMQWCPEEEGMRGIMIANLKRKVADLERGFAENYIFCEMFPSGIPSEVYDRLGQLCHAAAVGTKERVR